MATTVAFALNAANSQLVIDSTTDLLLLSDPGNLYEGAWNAVRQGNDLLITFAAGMGSILVTGQFATATPKLLAMRFENDPVVFNLTNGTTGTAGNDFIIGISGPDTINGGAGHNIIHGGAGHDSLTGSGLYDELIGGDGNDTLIGNGAETDFSPGAGNDSMVANGNDDWSGADYGDSTGSIIVNFSGTTISGQITNTVKEAAGTTDTLSGIEQVYGTSQNDTFYAGRLDMWNGGPAEIRGTEFQGRGGNDTFVGGNDVNSRMNVSYDDGGAQEAVIVNLSGNAITALGQTVQSMTAKDGVGGTDAFVLNNSAILIEGSEHSDYLVGRENANTTLIGGAGNDTLIGGSSNNDQAGYWGGDDIGTPKGIIANLTANEITVNGVTVQSNQVRDNFGYIDSLTNIDVIWGSDGDDVIYTAVNGGAGGEGGNDVLVGTDAGNEWFRASAGVDFIDGKGSSADSLGFDGSRSDYQVIKVSDSIFRFIKNDQSEDIFAQNIETFFFNDQTLSSASLVPNHGGTNSNDTLSGSGLLSGLDGNDSISGGTGDDVLIGGNGVDTLTGGAGNDTYVIVTDPTDVIVEDAGAGTDTVETMGPFSLASIANVENLTLINSLFNPSPLTLTGNTLANVITGNRANDILNGGNGNDTLIGNAGNDTLNGGTGDDSLLGGLGADTLNGGDGNDTLDGGLITDNYGGSDFNFVSYGSAATGITVDLTIGTASDGMGGTDTLLNVNLIQTGTGNDSITGSTTLVLEQFEGGAGNDTINGGLITDTLNGNNSNRVSFSNATAAVNVNLQTNSATGSATGNDTLSNINQVRGSNYSDSIHGSDRTDVTERFEGLGGNDTIIGGGGIDIVAYDRSGAGVEVNLQTGKALNDGIVFEVTPGNFAFGVDDLFGIEGIRGSAYNDTLTGGLAANGTDVSDGLIEIFQGNAGNDSINGGQGYDRADYVNSTNGIVANLATGRVEDGLGGVDTLVGIEGLRGSAHNDTLLGSDAAFESFEGREGYDFIDGKGGVDRVDYHTSTAGVSVNLAVGSATDGWGSADALVNIENVRGSRDFNDTIVGNSADNKLEGQGGNDTLDGGDGIDIAKFGGFNAGYSITRNGASWTVTDTNSADGDDGIDTLINIETIQFSDGTRFLKPVIADFNGDGKSDILWRNSSTGANAIWNAGNSSTGLAVSPISDLNWKTAGIGDFNGDGKSDILWRNASTGANAIWNAGNSATGLAVNPISDLNWKAAGIGDFNGDGKSDILWRNASTGANAIWNAGNSATGLAVAGIADLNWKAAGIGDFNGDGKSDILWRNASTGANAIWNAGNSATGLAVNPISDLNWKAAGIGDFNGDGNSDILWRNSSTGANAIWNAGNSATGLAVSSISDPNWKVAGTGDYNADGKDDILWRNTGTGADSIWLSANSSTPQAITSVSTDWQVLNPATSETIGLVKAARNDFNGDGKSDILWRNASTGADAIWNSGNSATPLAVNSVGDMAWKVAGIGDFNGDGKSDILWRNSSTGANAIWNAANSATGLAVNPISDPNWKAAGIGDFNGDGKSDVLWRNASTGANAIWNGGSSATSLAVNNVGDLNWKVAGIGDFNGDGKSDILWRNASTGSNAIWNAGNSATGLAVNAVGPQEWKVAGIGDFNGDGKSDILWRNANTGSNAIWNAGNSATPLAVNNVGDLNWKVAGTGDYNADGKDDILWRNASTGADAIWNGANSATALPVAAIPDLNWEAPAQTSTTLTAAGGYPV